MKKVVCKTYKNGKCTIIALNKHTCRAGCRECCLIKCFKDGMPLYLCPKGCYEGNAFDKIIFKSQAKKSVNVYGETIE